MSRRIGVLFVCMGNICRSPAAEGVFRTMAQREGVLAQLDVDSAGVIGYHAGQPADARMRAAATRRGYELESIARQFERRDFGRFQYILAMDDDNLQGMLRVAVTDTERERISMMMAWHPAPPLSEVPDPYYGGAAGFEQVLDLLEGACAGLLARVRADLDQ